MIIISHRGNIDGPNPIRENTVSFIKEALLLGYDVEIDIRAKDGKLYLGHDLCQEEIDWTFFVNDRFWVHVKNAEALEILYNWPQVNLFCHDSDDMVFTSKRHIWTFPGKPLINGAIAVLPEKCPGWDISKAGGVCTDYPAQYRL